MKLTESPMTGKRMLAAGRITRRFSATYVHAEDGGRVDADALLSSPESDIGPLVTITLADVRVSHTQWSDQHDIELRVSANERAGADVFLSPAQARRLIDRLETALARIERADPAQVVLEVAS